MQVTYFLVFEAKGLHQNLMIRSIYRVVLNMKGVISWLRHHLGILGNRAVKRGCPPTFILSCNFFTPSGNLGETLYGCH